MSGRAKLPRFAGRAAAIMTAAVVASLISGGAAQAQAPDPDGGAVSAAAKSSLQAPELPQNIKARANGSHVQLTWSQTTYPGAPVTGYRIYDGNGKLLGTTTTRSWIDPRSSLGKNYTYLLAAYGPGGQSIKNQFVAFVPTGSPPPTPTGFTANQGVGDYELHWDKVVDPTGRPVTGYNVYEQDFSGKEYVAATTTSTSWAEPWYGWNSSKTYSVAALGPGGPSAHTASITVDYVDVPGPEGLTFQNSGGHIDLLWTAVDQATAYKIYRNDKLIGTSDVPSFTDGTSSPKVSYTYAVAAITPAAPTRKSDTITAQLNATGKPVPGTPRYVSGWNETNHVQLQWDAVTNVQVTSYKVYRDGKSIATVTSKPGFTYVDFLDTTSKTGVTYTYTVTSVSGGVESGKSSPAKVKIGPLPSAATGLTKQNSNGHVKLSWKPVPGATSYEVIMQTEPDELGVGRGWRWGGPQTFWTNPSSTWGTTYTVTVRAMNKDGWGPTATLKVG